MLVGLFAPNDFSGSLGKWGVKKAIKDATYLNKS